MRTFITLPVLLLWRENQLVILSGCVLKETLFVFAQSENPNVYAVRVGYINSLESLIHAKGAEEVGDSNKKISDFMHPTILLSMIF